MALPKDFWNGTGNWNSDAGLWSLGTAPAAGQDTEVQSGIATLTAAGAAGSVQVDAGSVLQVQQGGVLTASGAATIAGGLYLSSGGSASTSDLSITGSGRIWIDSPFAAGTGGSSLTVNGTLTNTSTDNNALYIGNTNITAADTVTAQGLANSGAIHLSGSASASGRLNVNGEATNTGSALVDSGGQLNVGAGHGYTQAGGSTGVAAGGTLTAQTVDLTGGYLDGTGSVVGTVNNATGGTIYGGFQFGQPGTLSVNGVYNQGGTGTLEANISYNGTSSGVVAVTGNNFVNLTGGTLLLSGAPALGQVETVMTFGGGDLIGQFSHVQLGSAIGDGSNVALSDGTTVEVFYNNDAGTIQIERVSTASLATSYHWTGGTGNWSTASDWSGGQAPNPTADVVIGDTSTGNVTLDGSSGDTTVNSLSVLASNALTVSGVTLTAAAGAAGISVAAGGTLSLAGSGEIDGSELKGGGLMQTASGNSGVLAGDTIDAGATFQGQLNSNTTLLGPIANAGTIGVAGGSGTNSSLTIGNSVTLSGNGTVILTANTGGGTAFVQGSGQTLTNAGNTIEGTGVIGNGSLALVNEAVVEATPEGGTTGLTLNGGGVLNTGTLEAAGGGTLAINTTVQNAGGTISVVDAGSTVQILNATVQGGLLVNLAGTMATAGNSALDGSTLGALTIGAGSTYTASDGATTTLYGAIVNDGTISVVGGSGANGYLNIGNSVALSGGGTVLLSTNTGGGAAYIHGNGQTLTNADNTIEGSGTIGDGSLSVVNQKLIQAAPEGGNATLTLNGGGITNTGTLKATSTATLAVNTTVNNAGGTITAASGGTVQIVNATVQGGLLTTAGTGTLATVGSSTLDGTTQGTLTIGSGSTYTASNGASTFLLGTIANDGTIAVLGGSGANGYLAMGGDVTLSGGGAVVLSTRSGGGSAYIHGNGTTLTNVNDTIEGTGVIGDGNMVLVNHAVVDATPESDTASLLLNSSGGVTNTGTLEATGGGTLVVQTNVANAGGLVTAAGAGSAVTITGNATITGGTLSTTANGTMGTAGGNSATLSGVTIAAGTTYTSPLNSTTILNGAIVNHGTFDILGGSGNNTFLAMGSDVTLSGGGTVVLSTHTGSGNAVIHGNGQTLTNADNTIEGSGIIGDGNMVLVNQSVVDATPEADTASLLLNSGGGVTNTGTLEATGGGTLVVQTNVSNAGGLITAAGSGSAVTVTGGATITGGTLSESAGGSLGTAAGNSVTLSGVTVAAGTTYTSPLNSTTVLNGAIVNHGTFDIEGGNATNTFLAMSGDVTLSGGGTVILVTHSGSGDAVVHGNGTTLTNADNLIEGTGVIGDGNMVLVNQGIVDATPEAGTATLTLNGGGVTNSGTLEATGGGTLSIIGGTITNNGTVQALDGSAVTYGPGAGNANASGGTLTGGTWVAIANGHGATVSVTGGAVATDAATIVLSGAGSVFQGGDGTSFTAIENSLTGIATTGELDILGQRNYAVGAGALTDDGRLVLGGGTISGGALSIGALGLLTGYGTVSDLTSNAGIVDASGGTLDIATAVSGTGSFRIEAGSELELSGATAEGVTYQSGTGVLRVDQPATQNYTGIISGFGGSDILELANTDAVSVTPGTFDGTNTTLTVNLSGGGTLTYTLAGDYSSDHFGVTLVHGGVDSDIALSTLLSGTPTIAAPGPQTIGVGKTAAIGGVSVAESPTTGGETFTVVLSDAHGTLSANTGAAGGGGSVLQSNGGTTLTITGTLDQVNADLTTLTDTSATAGGDTIGVSVSDSNGGTANPASIAVTVNGLPSVAVPGAQAIFQGNATGIGGIVLSEAGNTAGETFTVTVADTHGLLAATGAGVSGSGTSSLTITGSLAQVNADLATLSDTNATAGADNISIGVTDSFGNTGSNTASIAVTPLSPEVSVPGAQTIAQGNATPITGITLSETHSVAGETFTVTLSDTHGLLSATGAGVSGSGTTTLTITGSLAQVNSDLATLSDTNATTGADNISIGVTDSFGNTGGATADVTVSTLSLSVSVPGPRTINQGNETGIGGIALSEPGSTSDETFTVVLSDAHGLLSATGAGVSGSGTSSLTITGSLAQVNADLATLSDTNATAGIDNIAVSASDSFGNTGGGTADITVAALTPVLAVPGAQTVHQGSSTAITGVSLSEANNVTGETFTVTLTDTNGLLSASGAGVSGAGTTTLTITGSLAQVNADLATLQDTDSVAGADTITLTAQDSFGNDAASASIGITATAASGPGVILFKTGSGITHEGPSVTGLSLTRQDRLYVLRGGTATGTTMAGHSTAYVALGGEADGTVINNQGLLYVVKGGTANGTVINAGGADIVTQGGIAHGTTVNLNGTEIVGAGGTAYDAMLASGGAQNVSGGGIAIGTQVEANGILRVGNGGVANAAIVGSGGMAFIHAGGAITGGLTLDGGEAIIAGSASAGQTVAFGGADGLLELENLPEFAATIGGFGAGDAIDLAGFGYAPGETRSFAPNGGNTGGTLTVTNGTHQAQLTLAGSYQTSDFTLSSDHAGGTLIRFA
ncbi:MAG: hypothetical protein JSR21_00905 [Proteobacteria bacterium]|nr:hypothetical protein [Pseudomonadota bacterium]